MEDGNGVTLTVTRAGAEHAEPHAEVIAILVPQILTQVVDRTVEDAQSQIVNCPVPVPRVMVQEAVPQTDRAIVYKDNLEEETLQADAEPVEVSSRVRTLTLRCTTRV